MCLLPEFSLVITCIGRPGLSWCRQIPGDIQVLSAFLAWLQLGTPHAVLARRP